MEKYKVGIIGGTGMVGQRFVSLMDGHPWFDLVVIAASAGSAGKTYEEAAGARWAIDTPMPQQFKSIIVKNAVADMEEIAAEVISGLLKAGKPLTKENMWSINTRYMRSQGKEFDSMRALLKGVITISYDEAEYMFNNDLLFSNKILGNIDDGLNLGAKDIAHIVGGIIKGVATGKLKMKTIKNLVNALGQSDKVTKLYDTYPESFDGFAEWKTKAEALWKEIGKLSETCDPEILKVLNVK